MKTKGESVLESLETRLNQEADGMALRIVNDAARPLFDLCCSLKQQKDEDISKIMNAILPVLKEKIFADLKQQLVKKLVGETVDDIEEMKT